MRKTWIMNCMAALFIMFILWGIHALSFAEQAFTIQMLDETHCAITGYQGNDVDLVIPETIDGKIVLEIGSNAFSGLQSLVSVTFPDSVQTIGNSAFAYCTGLEEVVFGSGLKTIGDSAFTNCGSWRSVNGFPSGLESIGSWAVNGPLHTIILPDTVTNIGYRAFDLNEADTFRWSAGVETIPDEFFRGSALVHMIIPEGVTAIGTQEGYGSVFCDCSRLEDITLPSTLRYIAKYSFHGCGELDNVTLPEGIPSIEEHTFSSCGSLSGIRIPDSVTSIGNLAFRDCQSLTSAVFGTGLEEIGEQAFCGCHSLTKIEMPDTVRTIGEQAFSNCSSAEEIHLSEKLKTIARDAFHGCSAVRSLSFPDSVQTIGNGAFGYCTGLEEVAFGSGLKMIGDNAFSNCGSWRSVNGFPSGLESIGSWAVNGPLHTIILPDTVTNIGYRAFDLNEADTFRWSAGVETIPDEFFRGSALVHMIIPEGVTAIGTQDGYGSVFRDCSRLEDISLPSSLTFLSRDSFTSCHSLKKVKLPSGLERIPSSAFVSCFSLTSVLIPESVADIAYDAFSDCPRLVLRVIKDSYGDLFAIERHLDHDYVLSSYNSLLVRLDLASEADRYTGTKLYLLQNGREKNVITLTGDRDTYEFADMALGDHYSVQLRGLQGDVFAQSDEISLTNKETEFTLRVPVQLSQATVQVLDDRGRDVTEQTSVTWMMNGVQLSSDETMPMQPAGKEVLLKIDLPKALLAVYRVPDEQMFTVSGLDQTFTVTLEPLPRKQISGRIIDNETELPVKNAVLFFEQQLQDSMTYYTNVKSNSAGQFALDLVDAPYTFTVRRSGYNDLSGVTAEGVLRIQPLIALRVDLDLSYFAASADGPAEAEINAGDLVVTAQDMRMEEARMVVLQYPSMVLPECNVGDPIRFVFSSRSDQFDPLVADLTLTGENDAITGSLTQRAMVCASTYNSANRMNRVALYNGAHQLVMAQDGIEGELVFSCVPDGTYTALFMGARPIAPTLEMMAEMGYIEHTDYILQPFQASAGYILSIAPEAQIPAADENELKYIDHPSVHINKPSLVAGNMLTLQVSAELKEEYAEAENLTWIISMPENSRYVEGTAMVGKVPASCTKNDGLYEVSAGSQSQDLMRMCISPVADGDYTIQVFLRFELQGKTRLQSVGSAHYEAKGLTFSAPASVNSASIVVRGTASSFANIYIYELDQLIGRTQAKANGDWSAEVSLNVDAYTSYHPLHVESQSAADSSLVVSSSTRLVRYSPGTIQPRSVVMVNTAHPATSATPQEYQTVFDYSGTDRSVSYYRYWPNYPDFTFLIYFSDNDPERITDVKLNIETSDGAVLVKKAAHSAAHSGWIVTESFSDSSVLPVRIGLNYTADNELIAREIQWDMTAIEESIVANASDDENKMSYSVRGETCDLVKTDVAIENVSLDEWNSLKNSQSFVLYDSDGSGQYYYTVQENSMGRSTSGVALVNSRGATMVWENVSSPTIDGVHQYFETLSRPEIKDLADGLMDSLDHPAQMDGNTPIGSAGTSCFPYSTDNAERLNDLYDKADEIMHNLFGEYTDAVANGAEVAGTLKDVMDNIESLMKHDIDFGPSVDLDTVKDMLDGTAKCADLFDNVRDSSLTPEQKYIMYANGAAGLALTAATSVAQGWLSTYAEAAKGLAIINNGVTDAWLKIRLNLSHDDAEIDRLIDRLNQNRDAYQQKLDNYDRYCQRLLDGLSGIPDRFFNFLGDYLQNHGRNCSPTIDSDEKTPELDPSGIVYETVPENVLEGVKATCIELVTDYDIYGDPYTYERIWNAGEFDQINPQITGPDGSYGWDVPNGTWRVRYEKEGYETAYSDWLVVPPPQFDVNVGMISHEAPHVVLTKVYPCEVSVTFSKYMRTDSLGDNMALVIVDGITAPGTWSWQNTFAETDSPENELSMHLVFTPEQPIPADARVRVQVSSQLCSYAGTAMQEEYSEAFGVIPVIESLQAAEQLELSYNETRTAAVQAEPGRDAAGMRVRVVPVSGTVVSASEEYITLNENGTGSVTLTGKAAGSTLCQFFLEGTDVTASMKVAVSMPVPEVLQVKTPEASVPSGSVFPYGTEIALTCDTPAASIYYSLEYVDGRVVDFTLYTQPFALRLCAVLRVKAVKAGMLDSEEATYYYRLDGDPVVRRTLTFAWTDWCTACQSTAALEMEALPETEISWSSQDEAVVSVREGRLMLKSAGETTVLARDGNYVVGEFTVRVEETEAGLVLPADTKCIEAEAFSGVSAVSAVRVPDGAVQIGEEAFGSCSGLRLVFIPSSVVSIGLNAFSGCHAEMYIIGTAGSAAEQYAAGNGIPFFELQ